METMKLGLRPQEAADALGISRAQMYVLLKDKIVPSVRIGGVRVIPVEALRKLVESRE